jgi:hypothetical protein
MEEATASAAYLRSGSTLSLNEHNSETTKMLGVRSPSLLLSRGPSYPCLVLDTSTELAEENLRRRSLHERIMTADPSAFRRKKVKDGPTSNQMELKRMQPLLGTMHPDKDPGNIDCSKKYHHSILLEKQQRDQERLDTLHFEHMPPMEDFLRPQDTSSPRSTGYEPGHIRSLLKLDTYGPTNSRQLSRERDISNLPLPNVDRYARLHPDHQLSVGSRSGSIGGLSSPTSSRASTAQSYASSLPRINKAYSSPELKIAPSMRSLFLRSSAPSSSSPLELTKPTTLRSDTFTPGDQRVTPNDRMLFDPNVKRKTWHEAYTQSKKAAAESRQFNQQVRQYIVAQQELAHVERRRVRDFEQHLVLAKFEW